MIIVSVVGNRPQYIKLSAIAREMKKHHHVIINTGQHYDYNLSKSFFKVLDIPEQDYDLQVGSGTHAQQTGTAMIRLEPILEDIDPDVVLVYGDTNSTVAGAVTAKKLGIPVAHIEAGCRSYEPYFAEEINRKIVDHVSNLWFCPTTRCVENLINEGICFDVYNTGDVMVDVLKKALPHAKPCEEGKYILTTIHRAENTDDQTNLKNIISNLGKCKERIIFPLHPRTRKMIDLFNIKIPKNVEIREPVDYISMISLLKGATHVVTDSGGLQKESFILGIPCTTVRPATEWPETLECGWNVLTSPKNIGKTIRNRLEKRPPVFLHFFGNGSAAREIVDILGDVID